MRSLSVIVIPAILGACAQAAPRPSTEGERLRRSPAGEAASTFSIVAWDRETGDLGCAVASRVLGVGCVVPWLEAGTGAIATQSYANTSYGPEGLKLLREGLSPEEVIAKLTGPDGEREFRQVGIVDAKGRTATYTGKRCIDWAGGKTGDAFAAQGNILVSAATVDAMASAFAGAKGELAERLMTALEAGDRAGGDSRGRQSAAIAVARKGGGYGGFNDRYVDLRVEDHADPVGELRRLLDIELGKDPLARARRLAREGHAAEAITVLQEAIVRYPGWDALRFEAARLLLASGEKEKGKAALAEAVARAPGHDNHHFQAARVLADAGLADECIEEAKKAIELNPEYAHVFRRELENPSSPLRPLRDRLEPLLPPAGK
jgi:uncharacterized Ntn-hydrolase superfamily protein